MANIIYRLSSKVDKISGKSEILVRFFAGRGMDFRAKTGIFIQKEYWDVKNERIKIPTTRFNTPEKQSLIKTLTGYNAELANLAKDIREAFLETDKDKLTSQWLEDYLKYRAISVKGRSLEDEKIGPSEGLDQTADFISTFKYFVSTQKISNYRIRHYNVIIRALQRFALYNCEELGFQTLTSDTLRDFASFLETEYEFILNDEKGKPYIEDPLYLAAYEAVPECRYPKKRGENTIIGVMSRLHTFIRWAIRNEYLTKDPFDNYEIGTAIYGTPFFITKEERNTLYAAKFPNNPGLEVQRDIFVFQCFIGCRIGDLMKMTKKNIINGAIEYVPRKTKEGRPWTVRVPISPTAQEILDRYANNNDDRLLPFICEQDYNRDIKKMLKLAGINRVVTTLNTITREEEKHPIWEVASSHMARRVLIGNLYREVKDPNLIAKISGHVENSKAFNRYRNIDEEMAKETIMKLE